MESSGLSSKLKIFIKNACLIILLLALPFVLPDRFVNAILTHLRIVFPVVFEFLATMFTFHVFSSIFEI